MIKLVNLLQEIEILSDKDKTLKLIDILKNESWIIEEYCDDSEYKNITLNELYNDIRSFLEDRIKDNDNNPETINIMNNILKCKNIEEFIIKYFEWDVYHAEYAALAMLGCYNDKKYKLAEKLFNMFKDNDFDFDS